MENEKVIITLKQYKQLLRDSQLLGALSDGGVDNWNGYDYAVEAWEMENDRSVSAVPNTSIEQKEYLELEDDSYQLKRLKEAGVDNWEGYKYWSR